MTTRSGALEEPEAARVAGCGPPRLELDGTHVPRRPRVLIALALLVPLAPVVVGAGLALATSGTATATWPRTVVALLARPSARLTVTPPQPLTGADDVIAWVRHEVRMRRSPGGRALAQQGTITSFGSPAVLLVRRTRPGWLGVISAFAGNGKLGWIPQSAASLSVVSWELRVSLAARRVTVLDDGRVLKRFEIAIGSPTAPTPTGVFAVTDRLDTHDPGGPYGCCILALSAVAPHVIQGWGGGDRIAIHSTPDSASIGQPVSHGCMRLTLPEGRWLIEHVPLGTPTVIRS